MTLATRSSYPRPTPAPPAVPGWESRPQGRSLVGVMRSLRWWSLLLVPGGFVAGHELAYQAASALGATPVTAGGHGYLTALLLIGAPFACAAMARSLVAGLRAELPPVRWSTLAAAQTALFLAVELAEHARAGLSPAATLAEPAVLFGLFAQLAVAAVLVRIVRTSHDAGLAVASRRRRVTPRGAVRRTWHPTPLAMAPTIVAVSSLSRRGPPVTAVS